jgi:hypothetical protein
MCYKDKDVERPGVWTSNELKIDYLVIARDSVITESVSFMENFVCENPFMDANVRRKKTKDKFFDQLKRVRYVTKKNKTPFAKNAVTVSGKVNELGNISDGFNDDLFITFGMCLYWMTIFYRGNMAGINYNAIQHLL